MRPPHVDYLGHKDYQCRRRGVHYLAHQHQAQWWVSVVNWHCRPWSEVFVDDDGYRIGGGDTIAEAMAAAGFGERKHDEYARNRQHKSRWVTEFQRGEGGLFSMTPLAYCQRPRKGVRLGHRKRKLAFGKSLDDAIQRVNLRRLLRLVAQLRMLVTDAAHERQRVGGDDNQDNTANARPGPEPVA
jgi:hypothetical protein